VSPNPILQKPDKRPAVARPDPRRKSSDDLTTMMAMDAAESRARAAMQLLEEEQCAREEEAKRRAELEHYNRALEKQLQQIASAPVKVEDTKSMRPGMLRLHGKDWKIAIPFTLLIAAVPYAWTVVQHVLAAQQQLTDLNKAVAGFQEEKDSRNKELADLHGEVASLKNTVARQAGYLAGALPMAGVSVPGAENGAIQVDIDREPDPAGVKHKPKVVTHTRIPAPAPDN
jgi:hypothetical protein